MRANGAAAAPQGVMFGETATHATHHALALTAGAGKKSVLGQGLELPGGGSLMACRAAGKFDANCLGRKCYTGHVTVPGFFSVSAE